MRINNPLRESNTSPKQTRNNPRIPLLMESPSIMIELHSQRRTIPRQLWQWVTRVPNGLHNIIAFGQIALILSRLDLLPAATVDLRQDLAGG
jgi:hypothetical protein